MDITLIPGQGVMLPGHDITRTAARYTAKNHLTTAAGWDFDDADAATEQAPVARAWYDGHQFVAEDHDGAQPVTVVNLPGGAR